MSHRLDESSLLGLDGGGGYISKTPCRSSCGPPSATATGRVWLIVWDLDPTCRSRGARLAPRGSAVGFHTFHTWTRSPNTYVAVLVLWGNRGRVVGRTQAAAVGASGLLSMSAGQRGGECCTLAVNVEMGASVSLTQLSNASVQCPPSFHPSIPPPLLSSSNK